MQLEFVRQVYESVVKDLFFDYVICSSGYERRSTYMLSKLSEENLRQSRKVCFCFMDRKVFSRSDNDNHYRQAGFSLFDVESDAISDFATLYHNIFNNEGKKSISILMDYSCMTSVLYASLLKYFESFSEKFESVSLYFSYTPAKFSEPEISGPLHYNQPIPFFDPIESTDKKIALIIGLGYDKGKALGLFEYFQNDPKDTYLFITGESSSGIFFQAVKTSNSDILNIVDANNILSYDLDNLHHLISTLDAIVNYLVSENNRVVIAPIGPKVFTLASMLVNMSHQDVTTYRLSGGHSSIPAEKIPDESKPLIIVQAQMRQSDNILKTE